jgi:alpha-tubulin suppressor-like RCC1 family protein
MILGLLLASLLIATFSPDIAGAAESPGMAFAWGDNSYGKLGNGLTGGAENVPTAVSDLRGVKSVKAGCDHGLALKRDGTVWGWGSNVFGQLGDGTFSRSSVPVKVKIGNVKAISAGCNHNLALKEDGSVWAWGDNFYGQLGNGSSGDGIGANLPVKVANMGTGARAIAAGNRFSLALTGDNRVKSWGYNVEGQLGIGTSGSDTSKSRPVLVPNLTNVATISTDSYADHTLVLLVDGTVWAWGGNYYGALGDGTAANFRATPAAVSRLSNVKAVATGGYHSLALLSNGRVKTWGYNSDGQLGNDSSGPGTNSSVPGAVTGLMNVQSISGGAYNSSAVLETGRVRSWGDNSRGQLGTGPTGPDSDIPVAVKNFTNVRNTDGGYEFTLAATE